MFAQSTGINMQTSHNPYDYIVFLVPIQQGIFTNKEYHIPPSLLQASYLREYAVGLAARPRNAPLVIKLIGTTVEQFDAYVSHLNKEDYIMLSEIAPRNTFDLAKTLGNFLVTNNNKPALDITADEARKEYTHLLGCYSLGHSMRDPRFEDVIVSRMLRMLRGVEGHQSEFVRLLTQSRVQLITTTYGKRSALFKLMTHAYARFATSHEIYLLAFSRYNDDFKNHVMNELGLLRKDQQIPGIARKPMDFAKMDCTFHAHSFYDYCSLRPKAE